MVGEQFWEPGWYQDGNRWRYWDGNDWTGYSAPTDPRLSPSFVRGDPASTNADHPAGWYPDPSAPWDASRSRYWDGTAWTEQISEGLPASPELAESLAESHAVSLFGLGGNFVAALTLLLIVLIVVLLAFIVPRLGGDGGDTTAGSTTTAATAASQATGSTVGGPCEEAIFDGEASATFDGAAPALIGADEVTGNRRVDCSVTVSLIWYGESTTEPSDNNPEGLVCFGIIGGFDASASDGTLTGSFTGNVGSYEPHIGAYGDGPRTCDEIYQLGEMGSYLGEAGNESWTGTGNLDGDTVSIHGVTSGIDRYPMAVVIDVELHRTG